MSFHSSAIVLAWLAILILAFAMAGLLQQVRRLSAGRSTQATMGLRSGMQAPPLRQDAQPLPEVNTVVLFLEPGCEVCERNLRRAEDLAEENEGDLHVVAIFPASADGFRPRRVEFVEHGSEAFSRYQVPLTPFGVAVDRSGRVVQAMPLGSEEALEELVARL
jgi:hypothetical protein